MPPTKSNCSCDTSVVLLNLNQNGQSEGASDKSPQGRGAFRFVLGVHKCAREQMGELDLAGSRDDGCWSLLSDSRRRRASK
jgi:hypothetical protein